MSLTPLRRIEPAAILGCATLMLVGFSSLLIPSLIRSIEGAFGQTDAGIGVYFFVSALAYAGGSFGGGYLTERLGRRIVFPVGVALIAIGLGALAVAPTWELFLLAGILFGLGGGVLDGGSNGLILDLYLTSRGRALNLLHLFYSIGALASPLVAGRLIEAGAAWQSILLGTAVAAVIVGAFMVVTPMPSGRHARVEGSAGRRIGLAWPLVALAIAIACYVGSEIGVSSWLVRFLEAATVGLATSALALFWGCLALGRLASARWSDRFDHARFAATAALISAVALVAASIVPSLPASIVLFGVVGFAFGPVYPLIMAVAGDLFPTRSAAVSGFLSGAAVVGAILYPPIMGFVSVGVGLQAAMLGAAVLALVCAAVLYAVARLSRRGEGEPVRTGSAARSSTARP